MTNKILKRVFCLIICFAMVFVMFPYGTTAFAETNSGICGDSLTWKYDSETATLTIFGIGKMYDFSTESAFSNTPAPWGSFCNKIKKLVVKSGVTSVSSYAFLGCTGIENIIIPDSVTNIGWGAFSSFNKIKTAGPVGSGYDYEFGWTEKIPEAAFYHLTGLINITIPESITEIGHCAFMGCTSLTSIVIPDNIVTFSGYYAFMGCKKLESVYFGKGLKEIKSIASWFSDCAKLKTITVDHDNPYYYSTGNCLIKTDEKKLILGCINSVIPDDGSVTSIGGYAFCSTRFTDLIIPYGIDTIEQYAIYHCNYLKSIHISKSVTAISGEAITGCSNLSSVTVDVDNPVYHSAGNCIIATDNKRLIFGCTNSEIPDDGSVNTIGWGAFGQSAGYTSFKVPEGVNRIEGDAFYTHGPISIVLPKSLTYIGPDAFSNVYGVDYVVYDGTEEEWNQIQIEKSWSDSNKALFEAKKYFKDSEDHPFTLSVENVVNNGLDVLSPSSFDDDSYWIEYEYSPQITITFCDETSITGTESEIVNKIQEKTGKSANLSYIDDQSQYNQWDIGEHKVRAYCLGAVTEFTVTVNESPVSYIEVNDISIMEGTNGFTNTDSNGNEYWHYSTLNPTFTVYFKDGTNMSNNYSIQVGGDWYYLGIDTSDQYDQPWSAGNTYEVTASLFGKTVTFNVTITKSPIARIEIPDMIITEFTHGYYQENGNYIYNNLFDNVTVVMNDGSIKKPDYGWIEYNNSSYSLSINYSEQYNEQWSAGNTYEVTASLLGESCTFNVTIKKSPIASIQMDDIEVIEYTNGNWKNDRYINNWLQFSGKAIMKDGSECILKFDGSGSDYDDGRIYRGFEVDGEKYSMFIDLSSQYEQPWTAGNTYQINCQALGLNDTFNIAVTENPIVSVAIDNLTLIQGMDSWYTGSYDYYNIYPTYTVTFKDGTQKTVENGNSVYVGGDSYPHSNFDIDVDQWQSPFEAGKTYELTGRIGPASNTFTLTIVENPVDWIEVLKNPDKTEYYDFEYFSLKGLSLRVHYKDGEHEDFTVESSGSTIREYSIFSEKYQRSDDIWNYEIYPVGQTNVSMNLFGKEFIIPITVIKNPIVSLSLSEDTDKSLLLTATKNDGTSEDWKIIAISGLDISSDDYITAHQINTDHGLFDMILRQDKNGYVIILNDSDNQEIKSNVLEKSEWLEVASLLPYNIAEKGYDWLVDSKNEHYLGNLTAGNIDATIRFLVESCPTFYWEDAIDSGESVDEDGNYEAYYIYTGDYVRQVLLKYLALDEIDLSLSNNYDSQTDTYRLVCSLSGDEFTLSRLEYKNGIWTAEYNIYWWDGPLTTYYCLNDEHKVIKIDDKAYTPGDINNDGKVNNKDLTRLFQYLSDWDVTVNEAALDVNGDGKVNNKDLTRLFQYLSDWDVEIF